MQSPKPNSRIKKFSKPHSYVVEETIVQAYIPTPIETKKPRSTTILAKDNRSKAASQTAYLQSQINARKATGQIQQRVATGNKLTATTAQLQAQIDYQRRRAKAGQ